MLNFTEEDLLAAESELRSAIENYGALPDGVDMYRSGNLVYGVVSYGGTTEIWQNNLARKKTVDASNQQSDGFGDIPPHIGHVWFSEDGALPILKRLITVVGPLQSLALAAEDEIVEDDDTF